MLLKLPSVTLFAIDSFTPIKTLRAMEFSTKFVDFGDVFLLTDVDRFEISHDTRFNKFRTPNAYGPGSVTCGWRVDHLNIGKIRLIPHKESDEKVARPAAIWHPPLPKDYERAVMVEPEKYVQTDYVLHMEWDSAVVNPLAWTKEFLKYDFIGAPWPRHHEPGWPVCDETNNVGNGGFALKSMKFCLAVADLCRKFDGDPMLISSDMGPCRGFRQWLEHNHGIKFAPADVAMRFSCENQIYTGQFGAHGRWTAELNGWGGPFWGEVRPKP